MSIAPVFDETDKLLMRGQEKYLVQQLHRIQTYSPPSLPEQHIDEEMPPTALFNFYDRHTAEHLRLKHVSRQPSLHEDLVLWADTKLNELRDSGLGVPRDTAVVEPSRKWIAKDQPRSAGNIYPGDLADRFITLIGSVCSPLASHWMISPSAPRHLLNLTRFTSYSLDDYKNRAKNYPWKGVTLHFISYDHVQKEGKVLYWLDNLTKEFFQARSGEDIMVFTFLPYSKQSAGVLRDMDRFFTMPEFPSSCCSTSGYTCTKDAKAETAGFDALDTPWLTPEPHQSAGRQDTPQNPASNQNRVLLPAGGRPVDFGKDGAVTPEGLLHHIWRQAVESDVTFIVMNCGDFERIGVRRRGTQTLYLSDMIEISKAQNPSYAKIYLGLHMAVLKDARDRHDQGRGNQVPVRASGLQKRKLEEIDMNPNVKRRCSQRNWLKSVWTTLSQEMDHTQPETKEFWKELHRRSLALVVVQDDTLNSPIPASCLRIGGALSPHGSGPRSKKWKESYKPRDSVNITLDGRLSQPTGNIHLATIELKLANGRTLMHSVVAKLAISPAERAQLKHEYSVYQHLWKHSVKGISCVFGLFEDIDNLATILVLERVGVSLLLRKPWDPRSDNSVELTRKERKACLSIVTDLHRSGVVHGCIHPRHILIGHDGRETIIDFSQAKLNGSEQEQEQEMVVMQFLVNGHETEEEPE